MNSHNYDDLIHLPHYQSTTHPHMPLCSRAAQFSPFAALTGYDDAVAEAGRMTQNEKELSSDLQEAINKKLTFCRRHQEDHPRLTLTFFVPDEKKDGGTYVTAIGNLENIDTQFCHLIFRNDQDAIITVPFDNITDIDAPAFEDYCP